MKKIFDVNTLLLLQIKKVEEWHIKEVLTHERDTFYNLVLIQHFTNFKLWHHEDQAREKSVSDSIIADIKRKIDKLNQKRNDQIEIIDEWIVKSLSDLKLQSLENAKMNSETPGNLIDRLSINSLKIYHMGEEALRKNITFSHKENCSQKLNILIEQRHDLGNCLHDLLSDLEKGLKILKVYRQLKMYNDPELNPKLYKSSRT